MIIKTSKLLFISIIVMLCTQSTKCSISHYGIEIHNKTGYQVTLDSIVSNEGSYILEIDTLINNHDNVHLILIKTDSLIQTNITHFFLYYKVSKLDELYPFKKKFKPKISTNSIQKIRLKE